MPDVSGEFSIQGWDEQTYVERAPGKMTQAAVGLKFSGGIEGSGKVQWLMCYRPDGTADFVGLQEITGATEGREGGFVVTCSGTFDGGQAAGAWSVVHGSGTGDLAGIEGTGAFTAPHGGQPTFELSYELA